MIIKQVAVLCYFILGSIEYLLSWRYKGKQILRLYLNRWYHNSAYRPKLCVCISPHHQTCINLYIKYKHPCTHSNYFRANNNNSKRKITLKCTLSNYSLKDMQIRHQNVRSSSQLHHSATQNTFSTTSVFNADKKSRTQHHPSSRFVQVNVRIFPQ